MKGVTVCGSLSRFPVSLGRVMHEAGYRALGLDWMYAPFACVDVADAVRGMRALSIRGLGVSMPFKVEVLPHLDDVTPQAARIGAVNTLVNDGGRVTGHNTDAGGAVAALSEVCALEGRRVLVLGAGGAAQAVVFGLVDAGARVTVANRSDEKAAALAARAGAAHARWDGAVAVDVDVLVNATSQGMEGVGLASPWPAERVRPEQVVMDIVYKPIETELARAARARGATVLTGERMLLHQAMGQFTLYTGLAAPRAAMEAALWQALR